ncbi:MAG: hypothetical protein Q8K57_12790 [Thiobacillus sp.]|nr:hypothetical protein [Thiobacillus sp.]
MNLPELSRIAQGRDHITTAEYGKAINRSGQTIRKNLCIDGDAYGVRPVKIRGRLLWPVTDIAAILSKEGV